LRTSGRALARRAVAAPLLIACAAAVGFAYRPLHMGWWDERSTSQAVRMLVIGICSLLAAHVGSRRVDESGGPRATHAAGAFCGLALFALSGMLYPLFALLALAPLMATGAASAPTNCSETRCFRPVARFGGWQRFAVLLIALEISLPLWDFQTDSRWALHFALGMLGAGSGVFVARRFPLVAVTLPLFALLCAAWSAFDSSFVIHPLRTLVIGTAAGWVLYPVLDAPARSSGGARLAWCTPLWMIGLLLGFVLSANRSFMALRLILWLPLLVPLIASFGGSLDRPRRRSA
jgi:hypothetical protein